MAPAPIPAITPVVKVRIGMFVLNGDTKRPIEPMILPEIHTFLIPNLFIKAPTIGPTIALTPDRREPIKETEDLVAPGNSSINGSNMTPNEYPKPSKMIH